MMMDRRRCYKFVLSPLYAVRIFYSNFKMYISYFVYVVIAQPPGIPEICKKSLTTCAAAGGIELFILGKNFLKDTKVVFQQHSSYDSQVERSEVLWEETVSPDKEYLQQVCKNISVPS